MRTPEAIKMFVVENLAGMLGIEAVQLDTSAPIANFAIDSISAMELVAAVEAYVDRALPPTILFDFPTIEALAQHLAAPEPA